MGAITGVVAVSLDCPDSHELAAFYATVLGTDITLEGDGYSSIYLGTLWLNLLQVDHYRRPTWPAVDIPQQVHFDLSVVDLDEGQREALAAGARLADFQPEPDDWRVMIDPVGHPFCLTLLTAERTPEP